MKIQFLAAIRSLGNPCSTLNKLKPGLEYKLLEHTGPDHDPKFKMAIELEGGKIFIGEGRSKKEAKQAAAIEFLQKWAASNQSKSLSQQVKQKPPSQDFNNYGKKRKIDENEAEPFSSNSKKVKISENTKNPVMVLNELKPRLNFDVEDCSDNKNNTRFIATVAKRGPIKFCGSKTSKILAKEACARMALTELNNLEFPNFEKILRD